MVYPPLHTAALETKASVDENKTRTAVWREQSGDGCTPLLSLFHTCCLLLFRAMWPFESAGSSFLLFLLFFCFLFLFVCLQTPLDMEERGLFIIIMLCSVIRDVHLHTHTHISTQTFYKEGLRMYNTVTHCVFFCFGSLS